MATRPWSPSVARPFPSGRSSSSRSAAPSRSTRRSCWSWTRRRARSIRRPSTSSRTRSRSSWWAGRRSSSPTASQRSRTSTASSSFTKDGSWRWGRTATCSRSAASTIASTSCSTARTSSSLRNACRALFVSLVVACAPLQPTAAPAKPGLAADRIQILHTDDIHGHLEAESVRSGATSFQLGGMAALAGQVAAYRARSPEHTVLLDSGDAWQGTFISNANKGEAVTKAMSLMRYDALALGNHEFDWGQDVVAQRAKEATFPFLAANVVDASGKVRAVGRTTIVDAGAYTENLGHLDLTIDPATRKVTAAQRSDELVAIAAGKVKADPDIAKIVEERRADGEKYTSRLVGKTVAALDNPREECGLGNLITDAFVEYGRQQGWKTDVAFYNMGGVRAPLPAGDISYGRLYQVLPFTNTIVSLDLTGAVLREVLEAA